MENKDLIKGLAYLGLPLFQPQEHLDANRVLSDTIKSNNIRLWESFPLLLANANKKGEFNYTEVIVLLGKRLDKSCFKHLFYYHLPFIDICI